MTKTKPFRITKKAANELLGFAFGEKERLIIFANGPDGRGWHGSGGYMKKGPAPTELQPMAESIVADYKSAETLAAIIESHDLGAVVIELDADCKAPDGAAFPSVLVAYCLAGLSGDVYLTHRGGLAALLVHQGPEIVGLVMPLFPKGGAK